MLTRFQVEWFDDAKKWVDAVIKTAAAESAENKELLSRWYTDWRARALDALRPAAALALGDGAAAALERVAAALDGRMSKAGLAV
jgi:phenol hydroxylase P1 protein